MRFSVDYHGAQIWCGILLHSHISYFLLTDHFQSFYLVAVVSSFPMFEYISGGSLLYVHDTFHSRGLFANYLLL
jgi:hypothetical protein